MTWTIQTKAQTNWSNSYHIPDIAFRQKAPFELADRDNKGAKRFNRSHYTKGKPIGRGFHGIWGIGQLGHEKNWKERSFMLPF